MVQTVKVLGEAPNIQFSGVEDKSGTNPILGVTNGLISGDFMKNGFLKKITIGVDKESSYFEFIFKECW